MEKEIFSLRKKGLCYRKIVEKLGLSFGKVWRVCNKERARKIDRDSSARYRARNCIPLVDYAVTHPNWWKL